ncbi:hypothetical protein [Streptomyces sp. NPDC101455]|uniref:hypothetical protein n=1 Tax=Streptomyces sp. NPDC101455 TaxID=3366142 RepID=UPI00381B960A
MTFPAATRVHTMLTFAGVACVAVGGNCLGLLPSGRPGGSRDRCGHGRSGCGYRSVLQRRRARAFFQVIRGDGYAQGIADVVLMNIAVYEAAVFPLSPCGVSEEEQEADHRNVPGPRDAVPTRR